VITCNLEDIVFEPENSLEALMQAAAKDPGVVPTFYRALLDTELYILTPEVPVKPGRRRSLKFREKINVASVEFQGMIWLPAFTSKKRISDYVKEPEACLGAAARNQMLPNVNFWLNPLSVCQKPLLLGERPNAPTTFLEEVTGLRVIAARKGGAWASSLTYCNVV
jgi:hypothetical protein